VKRLFIAVCLFAVSGCSLLQSEIGPTVAKQINRYCREPVASRMLVRTEVNAMITPNRVEVICAGDSQ
jgi:hypothetical protein